MELEEVLAIMNRKCLQAEEKEKIKKEVAEKGSYILEEKEFYDNYESIEVFRIMSKSKVMELLEFALFHNYININNLYLSKNFNEYLVFSYNGITMEEYQVVPITDNFYDIYLNNKEKGIRTDYERIIKEQLMFNNTNRTMLELLKYQK